MLFLSTSAVMCRWIFFIIFVPMDTTKRIIEEAESLMDFLYDDVETLFLPNEVLENIDFEDDDWQEKVKGFMLPIEIRWMNLIDDIQDAVSDFLMDYKEE